jgi:hypothetical protein
MKAHSLIMLMIIFYMIWKALGAFEGLEKTLVWIGFGGQRFHPS